LWKPESLVELVDGVPLTRIKYDEKGVPELSEEESQVPISRPLAKLHIASGATIPGNTAWETWDIQGHTSGFEVKIDTSAAGFTRVPCYFAWVQGRLWNRDSGNFFPVVFGHIDEVTATSFTHRLWMPRLSFPTEVYKKLKDRRLINENLKTKFLDFARRQKLFVSWLGIQPPHIDESEVNGESI